MGSLLLLGGTALHAGCGSSAGSFLPGTTTTLPADAPTGVRNEDPMARPVAVAWTSARATKCGFYFDPAKLRASYLAHEGRQGASGEQLAKIEKSYDTTIKVISEGMAGKEGYCTDKKGAEIKADLNRHLAGDFTPNLPKPKVVETCGGLFNPCESGASAEPFDSKKFWTKQDANPSKR